MRKPYTETQICETKEGIVAAARELYDEIGYEAINLLRLSKKTKLSRPSIYNYYHSKEEIFLDILLEEYAFFGNDLHEALTKERYDADSLADVITTVSLQHEGLLKMVACYESSVYTRSSSQHMARYKKGWLTSFYEPLLSSLRFQYPNEGDGKLTEFIYVFISLLHSFYPALTVKAEMREEGEKFIRRSILLSIKDIESEQAA